MPVTEVAIVVIAVALTAQTVMMAAAVVVGAKAWRRVQDDVKEMQASFDQRLDAVTTRIDEAIVDARIAARAVETLATRADHLVQDATSAAHSVRSAATMPRALLLTGAASAARWLASKVSPRRARSLPGAHTDRSGDVF